MHPIIFQEFQELVKNGFEVINQYGTIENLKEHMDELKGKMGEKVRTNIELGLLSKKIATIITDAPVELDLDAWKYEGQEYNDDLAEFYRRYDMNSLLKKNVSFYRNKTK